MRFRNLAINLGAIATQEETRKAVRDEEARLKLVKQLPPRGFGFNNLIANFAFLQFLQYFGDDIARNNFQTGYSLSPLYFANIIDRDPRFLSSYIYMSASVSMFAGAPSKAIEIYSKGLKSLDPDRQPSAYIVWRYKATDQLLFLGDAKGARESYLKAAEWADKASLSDEKLVEAHKISAELSRQSAQWLEGDRDLTKAQIGAWSLVLQNATDKKTVQIIAQELDKLNLKIEIKNGAQTIVAK